MAGSYYVVQCLWIQSSMKHTRDPKFEHDRCANMDAKAYLVVVASLLSSPQFSQTAAACKKNSSRATIGHVFMKSRLMRLLELVSYPRIQKPLYRTADPI